MCSSEYGPARVSFSRVKLPLYRPPPRRSQLSPSQSPFGKLLSAAEGIVQSWGSIAIRVRDSLLKHAAERPLTFAPLQLASLSMSSNAAEPESVRPKKRLQLGGQEGATSEEERVLISEILIQDKDGQELSDPELSSTAWEALKACKPNFALTTSEVQADVHRIIDTGFFASCMPTAEDTRDGVRLVFKVS